MRSNALKVAAILCGLPLATMLYCGSTNHAQPNSKVAIVSPFPTGHFTEGIVSPFPTGHVTEAIVSPFPTGHFTEGIVSPFPTGHVTEAIVAPFPTGHFTEHRRTLPDWACD